LCRKLCRTGENGATVAGMAGCEYEYDGALGEGTCGAPAEGGSVNTGGGWFHGPDSARYCKRHRRPEDRILIANWLLRRRAADLP
jgi:hypothetical protein